jgi:hypothetical protein
MANNSLGCMHASASQAMTVPNQRLKEELYVTVKNLAEIAN